MSSHKDRMSEIGFWAVPQVGTEARKRLEKYTEKNKDNPRIKKALKETFEKATALVAVQEKNGAGFSADKQLREYNLEYNGRVFHGSLHDMPSSFNVVEAFNKFLPPTATFELRGECDHVFSFENFIDWVTGGSVVPDSVTGHERMIEGKIYSYNSFDRPSSLLFRCEGGGEFGFSSVSLVRLGCEVSVLLIAGEKCDLNKESKKIVEQFEVLKPFAHRTHITPSEDLALRAEPLPEDTELWKTVVILRFDTANKTIDARSVYKDCGRSYQGVVGDFSDHLDKYSELTSEKLQKIREKSAQALKEHGVLFELCKTCLLLLEYFEANEDDVEIERHPTEFKGFRALLKNKKIIERVDPAHWISYREVRALRKVAVRSTDRASFHAPDYKIEQSGYWRKLPINVEGRNKSGNPIQGRTWVSQTLSWAEFPSVGSTVFASRSTSQSLGANPGYIYVMRSAAHSKDVFKVGLTRRTSEERSAELSGNTSAPDLFLVVQEWSTEDCVQAEKLIHAELNEYRINPNREYFKAPYKLIFSTIDRVISGMGNKNSCSTK